jgi:transposase-like protein
MDKKREIIRLKQEEVSQREISKILGCSEGYVSRIVKSFGLSNSIDEKFILKKFGSVTPIKRVGSDRYGHAKYLCVCDCGKSFQIIGNSLETGNTKSCGCSSRKRGQDHENWKGCGEISNTYFNRVKHGAVSRGLEFSITIEDMWDLFLKQDRKCKLSGITLCFMPTAKAHFLQTASLDRINSGFGYTIKNVQWIHKHLNAMKWKLHNNDFIYWCSLVTEYNKIGDK